jgi:hypothetical protein
MQHYLKKLQESFPLMLSIPAIVKNPGDKTFRELQQLP